MFGISNIWMAVAGAIIFGLVVWKVYDIGHSYGVAVGDAKIAQIQLQIEKKYAAQLEAMSAAAKAAQDQQKVLTEQLDKTESALNAQIDANEILAQKDPNAGNCGIGTDSTDRLNAIQ